MPRINIQAPRQCKREYGAITLFTSRGDAFTISACDEERVIARRWHKMENGYFVTDRQATDLPGKRKILLHRFIAEPTEDLTVDHIDHDKSNNCRTNLRVCTQSENSFNKKVSRANESGHKGVCYDSARKKWVAELSAHGKHIIKKRFNTKEEAIEAVRIAREKAHGKFARHA